MPNEILIYHTRIDPLIKNHMHSFYHNMIRAMVDFGGLPGPISTRSGKSWQRNNEPSCHLKVLRLWRHCQMERNLCRFLSSKSAPPNVCDEQHQSIKWCDITIIHVTTFVVLYLCNPVVQLLAEAGRPTSSRNPSLPPRVRWKDIFLEFSAEGLPVRVVLVW